MNAMNTATALADETNDFLFNPTAAKEPVALYMRYSSDNQVENSIQYQRTSLKAYCMTNNYLIVNEYVDRAQSGRTGKRDAFQRMIEDAKQKPRWKKILVYKLNRYFRNSREAQIYEGILNDLDIEIISVTQNIDATPAGRLMKEMLYAFDEYQSATNAEHTHSGMKQKAKDAFHCGGVPPLGYDVNADKKLVINEEEAETVRRIFSMVELGYSYNHMAELLNAEGRRTKEGKPFRKNSFISILRQEKYIGLFIWNRERQRKTNYTRNSHAQKPLEEQVRIEDGCPAIIDRDVFDRVQAILSARAGGSSDSKARHHYMMSGLKVLKCADCGSLMIGTVRTSRGRIYKTYVCPQHKRGCPTKEIRVEQVDTFVARALACQLYHRKDRESILAALHHDDTYETLCRKKAGNQRAAKNILKEIAKGSSPELTAALRELSAERKVLEQQIEEAAVRDIPSDDKGFKALCHRFQEHLVNSDDLDTKLYLKETVKEVLVGNDEVKITLNIV